MAKNENPGHYTASATRKYQANGPVAWGQLFRKVAGRDGREGEGIRAALAYAYEHADRFAAWADAHPLVLAGERGKGPKPAKAPKAKPAKAPEQTTLPEVR